MNENPSRAYRYHDKATVVVAASPEKVFDRLDDQARFFSAVPA